MRRQRRIRRPPPAGVRARHLRVAKTAVALLCLEGLLGPASSWWLRGWTPFERIHGFAGLAALALFVGLLVTGRRLERGRGRPIEAHARLAAAALLAGALAFGTGFVLLP